MAFSATFHNTSLSLSGFSLSFLRTPRPIPNPVRFTCVRAAKSLEPAKDGKISKSDAQQDDSNAQPPTAAPPPKQLPKRPVYSLKKGQIVRVDKEKYLNSINYLSVGHPPYYKGLDYIYEDRGEVLDMRIFETGEHALVAWVGIPTAPAWLPTDMLIKIEHQYRPVKNLNKYFMVIPDE